MFNPRKVVKALQQEHNKKIAEVQRISAAISVLSGFSAKNNVIEMPKKRRDLSPAARARIAKAQRERWAKHRATKQEKHVQVAKQTKKKKHWTQRPENQARVRKLTRKMSRLRLSA